MRFGASRAASWSRAAAVAGLSAALFLALIEPNSTRHLTFAQALIHWIVHIGVGLACAVAVMRVLLFWRSQLRPSLALLISGSMGAMLFAPLALGIEQIFPPQPLDVESSFLDRLETRGGGWALLTEFLQVWPQFLLVWILLNLPPVLAEMRAMPWVAQASPLPTGPPLRDAEPRRNRQPTLDRLPPAIGRELISASSDLQYLTVVTTRGNAMIIGSLHALEEEFGTGGQRIHRAHWVAVEHIRKIKRNGKGWICETSDGRQLPISRRRMSEVRERLGVDFSRGA